MKKIASLTMLIFCFILSKGQIVFDLSDKSTSTENIDSKIGASVIFKNLIPNERKAGRYSFTIDVKQETIPAITGFKGAANPCEEFKEIQDAINAINSATNENAISKPINKLRELLKNPPTGIKSDCLTTLQDLIDLTEFTKSFQFNLVNNQTITITVKRTGKTSTGDTTYIWTKIYKTPTKSPWHILYGFTFVPNVMNPVANYFSKADTSGKKYTITKLNNQRRDFFKNISPTIMITWTPESKYSWKKGERCKALFSNNFYQLGFVGGVSLNFASETGTVNIMTGPSLVIADNISLSGGIVLTQKSVLRGQYKEGDVIKENLDFDQLHENKYMAEWFISFAIRFDSNPFQKTSGK